MLFNKPGAYYMGRLSAGATMRREYYSSYNGSSFPTSGARGLMSGYQANKSTPAEPQLVYFWGRAIGETNQCLWLGPPSFPNSQNGLPRIGMDRTNAYLGDSSGSGTDTCSGTINGVSRPNYLSQDGGRNIGSRFNCATVQTPNVSGGTKTTVKEAANLYYNIAWDGNYTGGSAQGTGLSLVAGETVYYRYTTRDGSKAVVFSKTKGWGFMLASKLNLNAYNAATNSGGLWTGFWSAAVGPTEQDPPPNQYSCVV